jgi:hypothetical protein
MNIYEYHHIETTRGGKNRDRLHDYLFDDENAWEVYATHVVGMNARDYSVVYVIRRVVNR